MKMKTTSWIAGYALTLSLAASAAVAADGELTDFGAIKAANTDGSIPAYAGIGVGKLPADFKPGSGRYTDPFRDEKPLFSVSARNAAQYRQFLTPGVLALMERFPDYRIDVYPSHRTMVYPDWVLENTRKNAISAKLVGEVEGDGVEGAYAGIPFPQPKSGYEVMWNQLLRFQGARTDMRNQSFFVDRSGSKTLIGEQETKFMWPYYDRSTKGLEQWNFMTGRTQYFAPPAQAGQLFLQKYTMNNSVQNDLTWIYSPGQRRVRVAPEANYDTPAASMGGVITFDEIGGFNGRMDRFDFKLVGREEKFIPYNNYRALFTDGLVGEKHENPDLMRWEKHRVWVVEATLKPGKRHIYQKRTYYIDEDTWLSSLYEAYDHSGQLYRVANTMNIFMYDNPRLGQPGRNVYDLTKGTWASNVILADPNNYMIPYDEVPNQSRFTPATLAASGVR
ncbi:DUF1329 domain-containing protein [Pseudomonas sp. NBRC 100443]|uniref:DUF1329 domain-containing protein n=1 Tax=Pseudomonas sp. NBRC 100443 TaxID=1113665 RepID=UPI0024A542A8|nr:DUF1329 domain-containing protein [Pseudomonas sp. NBRC 100443]GLU37325.1 hypothetical protein Pssp01_14180 [Pseudomonas sp. NBRC 100443]